MANVTHKIAYGETLSEIVLYPEYKNLIPGSTVQAKIKSIQKLNPKIVNPDVIWAGDTIIISGEKGQEEEKNVTYKPKITKFGLINDNTLAAQWTWDKANTEKYKIRWKYKTRIGIEITSSSENTVDIADPGASRTSTYTIPSNATRVTFEVMAVAKNDEWEGTWSTKETFNTIETPGAPDISLEGFTITVTLDGLDEDLDGCVAEFQLVQNDKSIHGKNVQSTIKTGYASGKWESLNPDSKYKVRCRILREGSAVTEASSDWSPYSNTVETIPKAPSKFTEYRAESETSVYLSWTKTNTAESYEIEYTTEEDHFDKTPDEVKSVTNITLNYREITGLDSGDEYFFRVRAVNKNGESEWCDRVVSVIVGEEPSAPTTWSSVNTVNAGDPLNLYWAHNSRDGSSETFAELEVYINGSKEIIPTIEKSQDEDEKDKTSVYSIDTSKYTRVTEIRWRVKTAGVTNVFGDWSIERIIYIYPQPQITLSISDTENGSLIDMLGSLPLYISAETAADGQIPLEYYVTVTANEAYDTVDNVGNNKTVSEGELVYAKHIPVDSMSDTSLNIDITAGDIDLENNIPYTVNCLVSMDTGLTAEASINFTVAWIDDVYWPNADVTVDKETLVAHISPYCVDNNDELVDNVLLSVYRREANGTFTKIADNIQNDGVMGITDPHPSLDYARYRIVATSKTTGSISYYDRPGYLVGEKSAVIQWDETWSEFDILDDAEIVQTPWTGSILKLPYNLDVTDSYDVDVSHIKYIGREHPVSYYGTQVGETSSWNLEIDKRDVETLHTLRRLARWLGDVYVREPSGNGYWASITLSLPTKHCETTIPVSISITRVEGGV